MVSPLSLDHSLKIEEEQGSARFLFFFFFLPKTASACRKADQREIFLQSEATQKDCLSCNDLNLIVMGVGSWIDRCSMAR